MCKLISCAFHVDMAYVEMQFTDGCMISISCPAVEDKVAENRYQRSELGWLVYIELLTYAQLALTGNVNTYLKDSSGHGLQNETSLN